MDKQDNNINCEERSVKILLFQIVLFPQSLKAL